MTLRLHISHSRQPGRTKADAAFTLPELLVSIAVFSLVIGCIVAANLFGLRMFQITDNKLQASDAARKSIGKMTDEIRTCSSTWVGNITNGVFAAHLNGEKQTGNGLMIYPSTNTTNFILYFFNSSDQSFRRTTSAATNSTVVARAVTNNVIFRAQDYSGTVLTNNQNTRVIHLSLEFFRPARLGVVADYYKLETSVTRRAL
jgi:prepilin-type N-terminal cleavage/methylation domain-containing protein